MATRYAISVCDTGVYITANSCIRIPACACITPYDDDNDDALDEIKTATRKTIIENIKKLVPRSPFPASRRTFLPAMFDGDIRIIGHRDLPPKASEIAPLYMHMNLVQDASDAITEKTHSSCVYTTHEHNEAESECVVTSKIHALPPREQNAPNRATIDQLTPTTTISTVLPTTGKHARLDEVIVL